MIANSSPVRFVKVKERPEFGNHSPWRIEDTVDGQVMTRGLSEPMALELLDLMNRAFMKGCKQGDLETAQMLEALDSPLHLENGKGLTATFAMLARGEGPEVKP